MKQFVQGHKAILNKFSCCVYFDLDNDELCADLRLRANTDLVDSCNGCTDDSFAVCSLCNDVVCSECCDSYECSGCEIIHCPRCRRGNNLDEVTWCEAVGYGGDCPPQCSSCRLTGCKNGSNSCTECRSEVFDALLNECNTKQVQIDSQNDEISRLRSIIEEQERTIQANRVRAHEQFSKSCVIGIISQTGEVAQFRVKWTTKMTKVFLAYASLKKVDVSGLQFTLRGGLISPEQTPESLALKSNDLIRVAMFI